MIKVAWNPGRGPLQLGEALHKASQRVTILIARVLEMGAMQIRGSVQLGHWFKGGTGRLQQTLWVGKPKRDGDGVAVEMGWGVPYGALLEWGSTLSGWRIRAKKAKVLRFMVNGEVVYRKEVWHTYDDAKQHKPHWQPAIDKKWPDIVAMLQRIPAEAMR